jgi:hypothetical protein
MADENEQQQRQGNSSGAPTVKLPPFWSNSPAFRVCPHAFWSKECGHDLSKAYGQDVL